MIGGTIGEESEWKDIQFTMKDPEPEHDVTDYWLRGNRDIDRRSMRTVHLPHLCPTCRTEDVSNEWNECGVNARICENCNYVFWRRHNGMYTNAHEKDRIWESALRVRIMWESCPDTTVSVDTQRTRSSTCAPRSRSYEPQGRRREIGVANGFMDKPTAFRTILDQGEQAFVFFVEANL